MRVNVRTGFLAGIGAGMMAGAVAGAMMPYGRERTQVGKSLRKLGLAVDRAVDNVISDLR